MSEKTTSSEGDKRPTRRQLDALMEEHFPRIEPFERRSPNMRGDDPATDARDDEREAIDLFIDEIVEAGFALPDA